ncbi:MAG: hypothetical protein JRJ03_07060 [Deltaproteobacteria bacterium]|nr:hypothetical protein [Deltaproteobacteria bacterium]
MARSRLSTVIITLNEEENIRRCLDSISLQQGFRDGVHGLILSLMAAFNVFLIHANCWQLQGNLLGGEKKTPR